MHARRLLFALCVFALIPASRVAAAPADAHSAAPIGATSNLVIGLGRAGLSARRVLADDGAAGVRGVPVAIGASLAAATRRATVAFFASPRPMRQARRSFYLLAVSVPSVARLGGGYCGAGSEDRLLTVEWVAGPARLELRDTLLVQSCLGSMLLRSDAGGDLRTALPAIDDGSSFALSWLSHPRFGQAARQVRIEDGRFRLSP